MRTIVQKIWSLCVCVSHSGKIYINVHTSHFTVSHFVNKVNMWRIVFALVVLRLATNTTLDPKTGHV